jgi:hypothetical protein
MPSALDHIVIVSNDLDTAIVNARAAGFTVVPGGMHGSGHTHNALIAFADGAYIELFAPTDQGRTAEHRWFDRLRRGGGLVDFCLLSSGLAAEVAALRERGIEYSAPFTMQRVKPDGTRIAWSLSTAPGAVGESGWPFMIEDATPRALRVPHEPAQTRHAIGALGVAGITVLARDVEKLTREYEGILGAAATASKSQGDQKTAGSVLPLGAMWILLKAAISAEETQHLARHGQGPFQITLRCRDAAIDAGTSSLIDPALLSGARVALA